MSRDDESIEVSLNRVLGTISAAAQRRGCDASVITLVAVSKTKSIDQMRAYADAAARLNIPVVFGESYLQEIKEKHPKLREGSELHMIGPLQSNKVRDAVALCDVIESVHSTKVIELVAKEAARIKKRQRLLLQVNIGRDRNKSGFLVGEIESAITLCERYASNLQLEGLMTILPYDQDPEQSRPHFKAMAELRSQLAHRSLDKAFFNKTILLSMGMSDDFAIAIEEGGEMVRVGTALFGERIPS